MTNLEQHRLPRRRFLSGMAGGAAALALSGLPGATALAAEDRWKMKLSCSSISYSKLSIEEACQRIAKLGFEAIDIWSPHAGCPHLDDVQTRLGPNGLKELLEKNKLKLYSFSVYQGGYPKYAELLGKSGGGVAVRGSSGPCKPDELKAKMKQFIESLKPELELAEKYDSYLAIENHGHALLNTHDSFKAFVEANDNPRLGIALAPYHIQAAGESVEDVIATVGKQLQFFYAWQRSPGAKQLPGVGPTDCTPWISALAKAKYAWYVNPFMHHEPKPDEMSKLMAQSCKYLEGCYKKSVGS